MTLVLVERDGGTLLRVRAAPGSKRERIVGVHGDALKIAIAAPPERGKANQRIVEVLERALGLARGSIMLVAGETSRDKRVLVSSIDADTLRGLIDALLTRR